MSLQCLSIRPYLFLPKSFRSKITLIIELITVITAAGTQKLGQNKDTPNEIAVSAIINCLVLSLIYVSKVPKKTLAAHSLTLLGFIG